jgi:hypothetical protein
MCLSAIFCFLCLFLSFHSKYVSAKPILILAPEWNDDTAKPHPISKGRVVSSVSLAYNGDSARWVNLLLLLIIPLTLLLFEGRQVRRSVSTDVSVHRPLVKYYPDSLCSPVGVPLSQMRLHLRFLLSYGRYSQRWGKVTMGHCRTMHMQTIASGWNYMPRWFRSPPRLCKKKQGHTRTMDRLRKRDTWRTWSRL